MLLRENDDLKAKRKEDSRIVDMLTGNLREIRH